MVPGCRPSPWLGHLMISRQETALPLLTPGEVMQLPPDDELVLVSGCPPIARKARYYEDPELKALILQPPLLTSHESPPPEEDLPLREAGELGRCGCAAARSDHHGRSRQRRYPA